MKESKKMLGRKFLLLALLLRGAGLLFLAILFCASTSHAQSAWTVARYRWLGTPPPAGTLIRANQMQLSDVFAFTGNNTHAGTETFNSVVAFPNTSSSSVGVITFGGTTFVHDFGNGGALGAFVGLGAGNFTFTGVNNNGFGYHTGASLTTGAGNNAFGTNALAGNTTGTSNDAFGGAALFANVGGSNNSAFGDGVLTANTSGIQNSAFGSGAMAASTTANNNSAFGVQALASLVGGSATNSSAFGVTALKSVTTGTNNNAFGLDALRNLTTGSNNMAFGVGVGGGAGANYTSSESNNIVIGNLGVTGESGVVRIGTGGTHLQTFLSGAVFLPQIGNSTGLQIFNTTTTCTTAASVGATCATANISLPVAEADTSYRVSCTGKGPTAVPVVSSTANSSATQFTITIAALTAVAASFSSYDCVAGHN